MPAKLRVWGVVTQMTAPSPGFKVMVGVDHEPFWKLLVVKVRADSSHL
jgi:hypothetical protein